MNLHKIFLIVDEKQKKNLGVNVSNFKTYTRYFGVAHEKQKSKKS